MSSDEQLRATILDALRSRGVVVTNLEVAIHEDSVALTGNVTNFHSLQLLQRHLRELVGNRRVILEVVVSSGEAPPECPAAPRCELSDLRGRLQNIMQALKELQSSLNHADVEHSREIVEKLLRRSSDGEAQASTRTISQPGNPYRNPSLADRHKASATTWLDLAGRIHRRRRIHTRLELEA